MLRYSMPPTSPTNPAAAPKTSSGQDELEQSLKAREVEGALDLLFYRKLGLRLARFFAACRLTPDHVTMLGTLCGIAAGHLYFYRSLGVNCAGMLLQVTANLLDNVDGQLARLTNRQSETGKVIDGIGDYLVFLSVYLHLCLRQMATGGSGWVWLLATIAALCHVIQSAAAEFSRDAYVRFAKARGGQLQSSRSIRERARALRNLLLHLHANYAQTQERALPALARLRDAIATNFAAGIPDWFAQEYQSAHEGVPRRSRLLGTSTRMLALFIALFLRYPLGYFIFEITIMNAIFAWLVFREQRASSHLLQMIPKRAAH